MLYVQLLSTSRSSSSIHSEVIVGPVTCTAQYKRHSSNGTWSPYFFISPDLPPIYALQVLLEKVHAWTHLPWFVLKNFHTYILYYFLTHLENILENMLPGHYSPHVKTFLTEKILLLGKKFCTGNLLNKIQQV